MSTQDTEKPGDPANKPDPQPSDTKTPTAPPADPPPPAQTDNAHPVKVLFGVTLDIDGHVLIVDTDQLANVRAKGIDFSLHKPLHLGTLKNAQTVLQSKFGLDTSSLEQLPPPFGNVVDTLASLDFTMEQFHIKIPGTANPGPRLYTVKLSADAPDGITIIPNFLKMDGFVFGVTNEGAELDDTSNGAAPTLPPGGGPPALKPGAPTQGTGTQPASETPSSETKPPTETSPASETKPPAEPAPHT